MENLKEYLPIFVSVIAASSAIFGYLYQSSRALKDKQLLDRKAQYETILFNVFKLLYQPPGLEYANTLIEIEKSWLYASDDVLEKCYVILKVHKEISTHEAGPSLDALRSSPEAKEEYNQALRSLFSAMRKDLGFGDNKNIRKWPTDEVELFPAGLLAMNSSNTNA